MTAKKTITKKAATKTTKPAAKKPAKAASKNGDAKPKKLSALDAAAKVLAESKEPLNTRQMIEAMAKKGLWTSPGGATPWATLCTVVTMLPKAC
jgi:HB1, ASXL, restriction endonuclease HTH domain